MDHSFSASAGEPTFPISTSAASDFLGSPVFKVRGEGFASTQVIRLEQLDNRPHSVVIAQTDPTGRRITTSTTRLDVSSRMFPSDPRRVLMSVLMNDLKHRRPSLSVREKSSLATQLARTVTIPVTLIIDADTYAGTSLEILGVTGKAVETSTAIVCIISEAEPDSTPTELVAAS